MHAKIPRSRVAGQRPSNAWKFDAGTFLDPSGWSETAAPTGFTPACLQAYLAAAARQEGQDVVELIGIESTTS